MNILSEYNEKKWKNIPPRESSCFSDADKSLDYEQFIDKILDFPYNWIGIYHNECEEIFYEDYDQAPWLWKGYGFAAAWT